MVLHTSCCPSGSQCSGFFRTWWAPPHQAPAQGADVACPLGQCGHWPLASPSRQQLRRRSPGAGSRGAWCWRGRGWPVDEAPSGFTHRMAAPRHRLDGTSADTWFLPETNSALTHPSCALCHPSTLSSTCLQGTGPFRASYLTVLGAGTRSRVTA